MPARAGARGLFPLPLIGEPDRPPPSRSISARVRSRNSKLRRAVRISNHAITALNHLHLSFYRSGEPSASSSTTSPQQARLLEQVFDSAKRFNSRLASSAARGSGNPDVLPSHYQIELQHLPSASYSKGFNAIEIEAEFSKSSLKMMCQSF
jgi:hypothetical protein